MIKYVAVSDGENIKDVLNGGNNGIWFIEKEKPKVAYIKLKIKWSFDPRYDFQRKKSNLFIFRIKKIIRKFSAWLSKISEE